MPTVSKGASNPSYASSDNSTKHAFEPSRTHCCDTRECFQHICDVRPKINGSWKPVTAILNQNLVEIRINKQINAFREKMHNCDTETLNMAWNTPKAHWRETSEPVCTVHTKVWTKALVLDHMPQHFNLRFMRYWQIDMREKL